MLADGNRCRSTFTGGTDQLLCTARTHITGRENALRARLEIHARQNKPLIVKFNDIAEWFAVWLQADKDKDPRNMQFPRLTRFVVLDNNGIQVVLLPFELDDSGIKAHLDLRRVQRL